MNLRQNYGFTLVELMVAAYILLIGICGILALITNSMVATEAAWDTTVATTHAQYILEEMQNKNTLGDVQRVDWNAWAQNQSLITLPQETLNVSFVDPTADPLEIKVTDQWQRKGRLNTITLRTKLTK